jgi:hypothetical protein
MSKCASMPVLPSYLAAVAGATPGRASTAAAHDKLYARVLEFISLAGGMELALSDEGAKEEVGPCLVLTNE